MIIPALGHVHLQGLSAGVALVGAFATGAQIFRRGGLMVEASNSHSDYFQRNLTAIRAETRLALAVYRPEAFATADIWTLELSSSPHENEGGASEVIWPGVPPSPQRRERLMALNQDQLDALSTAVILAQAGVGFTVEDEAKRMVCDGLIRTGHLAPIAGVPNGYTVGDQIAQGMIANTVQKSEQAKDN